jgi:NAD(P)H-hydrate epimerase
MASSNNRSMPSIHAGWSAAQVRDAERPLLEAGEPLMQRAAAGLAAEIGRVIGDRSAQDGTVLVLAGSGNNGGDALFAAATLAAGGHRVTIVALGSHLHDEGLAAALDAGGRLAPSADPDAVVELARHADVIVDGILGTGAAASPALRSPAREVVAAVRAAGTSAAVVAVDLPSGLSPDDGRVVEPVLAADVTVTFGAMKAGLLLQPGASVAGRIILIDIGLGPYLRGEPVVGAA